MGQHDQLKGKWALILGASSGFGAATARKLASEGMNIFGVHLDRRAGMPAVEQLIADIDAAGAKAHFVNMNAADDELRAKALDEFPGGEGSIAILMHSLAFGTLKPYVDEERQPQMNRKHIEMTLDVMAHSLVYWSQDVVSRKLMGEGGCIYAMTSSGGTRVIPSYGAVSAAKASLESHIRQLCNELGPFGIRANSIRAGVTDTPALRKIPGNDKLLADAAAKNPRRRLTTPEDVAGTVWALSLPECSFVSGNVIGVDGGEDIVG